MRSIFEKLIIRQHNKIILEDLIRNVISGNHLPKCVLCIFISGAIVVAYPSVVDGVASVPESWCCRASSCCLGRPPGWGGGAPPLTLWASRNFLPPGGPPILRHAREWWMIIFKRQRMTPWADSSKNGTSVDLYSDFCSELQKRPYLWKNPGLTQS